MPYQEFVLSTSVTKVQLLFCFLAHGNIRRSASTWRTVPGKDTRNEGQADHPFPILKSWGHQS
eukprot:290007-Amphidinium_carterae.1